MQSLRVECPIPVVRLFHRFHDQRKESGPGRHNERSTGLLNKHLGSPSAQFLAPRNRTARPTNIIMGDMNFSPLVAHEPFFCRKRTQRSQRNRFLRSLRSLAANTIVSTFPGVRLLAGMVNPLLVFSVRCIFGTPGRFSHQLETKNVGSRLGFPHITSIMYTAKNIDGFANYSTPPLLSRNSIMSGSAFRSMAAPKGVRSSRL